MIGTIPPRFSYDHLHSSSSQAIFSSSRRYLVVINEDGRYRPYSRLMPTLGKLAWAHLSCSHMSFGRKTKVTSSLNRATCALLSQLTDFVDMLNAMRFGQIDDKAARAFAALSRRVEYADGIEPTELCVLHFI